MSGKQRKNKAVFSRPALAAFILIITGAVFLYFWPEFPGQVWTVTDYADPEAIEEEDLSKEDDAGEEPPADLEDVNDPFEDRDDHEEPQEKAEEQEDKVKEEAVEPAEEELTTPDKDLKVISDGDCLLALVTKETTLKEDYAPVDLEAIPSYMNPSYSMRLRSEALEHLEKLWKAANEDGVTLSIRSAYRSYETQKQLFKDYASRHGEEEANRFSARPGQSEHQLGTAVDFGGTDADFTARFGQTKQGRWLAKNAHKYGFALSYPRDKESITGYIYEPWHFRYIGVDHARQWKQSGLTLKEYLEKQPQEFE